MLATWTLNFSVQYSDVRFRILKYWTSDHMSHNFSRPVMQTLVLPGNGRSIRLQLFKHSIPSAHLELASILTHEDQFGECWVCRCGVSTEHPSLSWQYSRANLHIHRVFSYAVPHPSTLCMLVGYLKKQKTRREGIARVKEDWGLRKGPSGLLKPILKRLWASP